ncbi:MAG: glycosyltransferase family 9 protein [Bacteroidetes bacterium]|jgi:ADP-heptose:LPS heptosyltransferase|nr:glycosyltransferase family 9 protein [Bacteroidota bacterium]MBK7589115.1 glycosyltransferase family 9 protein [Bacteroidota bacterium]
MKILIIRFSSIGDIVLTTPIIRCVKKRWPHAEIHFLTKSKFKDVVKNNPYLTKVHTIIDDAQPIMLELIRENYHMVIDLHNNLRTWYVKSILKQAFNSQVTSYTFSKINIRKWLLTQLKINILPDKSIVERYFEALHKIGVTNDGQGLDYFIASDEEVTKDDLPFSHVLGFIACSIGGAHETKKMPVEKWKAVCEAIDYPLILLGGKEDAPQAEMIKQIDPVKIYNACGKFSINESAHIIMKSRFVISHDTGLMHIAAAFKKPIISIWGNTVPSLGMFPYYGYNNLKKNIAPQLYIIENNQLSCRPCSKIGYSACPKKHFKCMEQISTTSIVAAAEKIILSLKS